MRLTVVEIELCAKYAAAPSIISTKWRCAARCALPLAALSTFLLAGAQPGLARSETVLYSFRGPPDGQFPDAGVPVLDNAGNIYGTTLQGGAHDRGTVWKLTPSGVETILWNFAGGPDGAEAVGLSMDKEGNLYGTTDEGGAYKGGTVFEVTPSGTKKVLWNFGNGADGSQPEAVPILDSKGNLFGTTMFGGDYKRGTVYELTPSGTETVLWSFGNINDGAEPASPVLDANGTLYGTTHAGGSTDRGTVWKMAPSGTETVLHTFTLQEGAEPDSNVILDRDGNLYSNSHEGGLYEDGAVWRLGPSGKLKILHAFDGTDGAYNYSTIVQKGGNFYGTTYEGGSYNGGTVWEMTRSGKLTVLWNLGNGLDGNKTTSGVAMDGRGNIYGMTWFGGTGHCKAGQHSGCGTVFKITPQLLQKAGLPESHPGQGSIC